METLTLHPRLFVRIICLVVLLVPVLSFAQDPAKYVEFRNWDRRVETLISSIKTDCRLVDDSECAVYLAHASKMLLVSKQPESMTMRERSAKLLLSSIESDSGPDLAKKIRNAQKAIQLIAAIDGPLAETIAQNLNESLSKRSGNSAQSADLLVSLALQFAESKPELAYSLGARALRNGMPLEIFRLIGELNVRNTVLAEQLFRESMIKARRDYDLRFISKLSFIAFSPYKGRSMSDGVRAEFLDFLIARLNRVTVTPAERGAGCEIAVVIAPLVSETARLRPTELTTVRMQLDLCSPYLPAVNAPRPEEENLKTFEDYLAEARRTNDRLLRAKYFYKAIRLLEDAREFAKIVSLLDSMTEDEVNAVGNESWSFWRIEYAVQLIKAYLAEGEIRSADAVIASSPTRFRPAVRINSVFGLDAKQLADFVIENLDKARSEARSIGIPGRDKAGYFLTLMQLNSTLRPAELVEIFDDAVTGINAADAENPENRPELDYAPMRDVISMPEELLVYGGDLVFSSIKNVNSARSRVRLELGLLEPALQKWLASKAALAAEKPSTD